MDLIGRGVRPDFGRARHPEVLASGYSEHEVERKIMEKLL
jgi:hypothetical protein